MTRKLRVCAVGIFLLCPLPLGGQAQKPKLLPTDSSASKIRAIRGGLLADWAHDTTPEAVQADRTRREREFRQLADTVSTFVTAQLEAAPEIEQWQLRDRLIRVLGTKFDDGDLDRFHEPPYVFRVLRLKKELPAVWAVCYGDSVWNGMGGLRTVVDSYTVENGRARLAGRGGSEMNGYALTAEQIWNPAENSTSVLTHGIYTWSSGHELPARVVLYGIGAAGVKTLWQFSAPGILVLDSYDMMGFAIRYHDEDRHSKNLPATAFDVYFTGESEVPYRTVHQFEAYPKR